MKSKNCTCEISSRGAEITSLTYKGKQIMKEGMDIWGYTSPYLFPTIGRSIDGTITIDGNAYKIPSHGVVRTEAFERVYQTETEEIWEFYDNAKSYESYPFHFCFQVRYVLEDSRLNISIKITNLSHHAMPFQLGLHPAFQIKGIQNYTLHFEKPETITTPTVNANGTLDFTKATNTYENLSDMTFQYSDFDIDTIVMKHLQSRYVDFSSKLDTYKLHFEYPDFCNLAIWTNGAKQAPFLCIEPWCGHSDLWDSDHDLRKRPDIVELSPDEEKTFHFSFSFLDR